MKTIFWLRSRKNTNVIHLRITIDKIQKNYSTGISCDRIHWIGKEGTWVNPSDETTAPLNARLIKIRADFETAYQSVIDHGYKPTAEAVIKTYLDTLVEKITRPEMPADTISEVLNKVYKLKAFEVGTSIGIKTYARYLRFGKTFLKFLAEVKIKPDHKIERIGLHIANGFLHWLSNHKHYLPTYVNKHRDLIIAILDYCDREGINLRFKSKDLIRLKEDDPELVFLTPEEYDKILNFLAVGKLADVKNILIFLCETGVHIGDYRAIRKNGVIEYDKDGDAWIKHSRIKTNSTFDILLSDVAMAIIGRYGSLQKLPILSDQKINEHLKVLGSWCQIDKNMTTKIGRKTFSHLNLNRRAVREEIVAKLLGLKSTACLKHYVRADRDLIKSQFKKNNVAL